MNPKEAVIYLTGIDYLKRQINRERNLIRASTGLGDALPLETNLKTAGEIYARRLSIFITYPIIVTSRITGIDAAVRAVRGKLMK